MSALAARLRSIFATALGLAPEYLENKFQGHLSSLRVIDYPEQSVPPAPGQLRAGAHSDYGVLTILRTEDAPGGLQVRTRTGRWSDVPHISGSLVVNIGDAMTRWTNDRWVSTQHRVVNPPANRESPSCRLSQPRLLRVGRRLPQPTARRRHPRPAPTRCLPPDSGGRELPLFQTHASAPKIQCCHRRKTH